ncbi:hypothetical protein GCM10010451_06490 [Streptomyces virens]|uniref:Uncharacterized protein n=1 Tax=Streptomyces virens TaxID=285572 RepID=A0ABP6P2W6_9ACTN
MPTDSDRPGPGGIPGRQDPPPGPDGLQMAPQQTGEVVDGARGQWQTALVDKRAGVLFGSLHTVPNGRRRHRGYVRAAPFRAALDGLAPSTDSSQQVRVVSPS